MASARALPPQWNYFEPNNSGGEDCAELYAFTYAGVWNDVSCAALNMCACELLSSPRPSAAPSSSAPTRSPAPTAARFELQADLGAVTYAECDARCAGLGGQMPCVTRDTVNLELAELSDHAWIGFTDKGHEGRWTWEYGCESDFTNWLPGEPNDYGGDAAYGSGYGYGYYYDDDGDGEDCATLSGGDAQWNDLDCAASVECVCELLLTPRPSLAPTRTFGPTSERVDTGDVCVGNGASRTRVTIDGSLPTLVGDGNAGDWTAIHDADMVADATGVCNWDFMSVDEIASSMYGYAAATDGIFQSSNAYGNPSINGPSCL